MIVPIDLHGMFVVQRAHDDGLGHLLTHRDVCVFTRRRTRRLRKALDLQVRLELLQPGLKPSSAERLVLDFKLLHVGEIGAHNLYNCLRKVKSS